MQPVDKFSTQFIPETKITKGKTTPPTVGKEKLSYTSGAKTPEIDVAEVIASFKAAGPRMTTSELIAYLQTSRNIVVTQDVFERLFPKGFVDKAQGPKGSGKAELWREDSEFNPDLLNELMKALQEGRVASLVSRDGQVHSKLSYASAFEEELHAKSQDYDKSKIIAAAFSKHFSYLSHAEQNKLKEKILKYNDFIGVRKDHIQKILKSSRTIREVFNSPYGKKALIDFTGEVYNNMSIMIKSSILDADKARKDAGLPPIKPDTVVITTTSSGGAHRSIASVIDANLAKREIPHTVVNESELVPHDKLESFVGLPRSDIFNKVSQQSGQMAYGKKIKLLDDAINQFVPDPTMSALRKAVGSSQLVVSTSHHPENVRLAAESEARVCFQICDFGSIPDKIENIAKTVSKYNLTGITFFMPSESSTLKVSNLSDKPASPRSKRSKTESLESSREIETRFRNYEHFARVHRYPVHEAFLSKPDRSEVDALKEKLKLRQDAKL